MKNIQYPVSSLRGLRQTILFTVVFIGLSISSLVANAAKYYISSTAGNDQNTSLQAQNPATPWKTLSKLNSFMPSLISGDSVLFKRGDIFDGSIVISKSGAALSPIVFAAFGQGNRPVISGLVGLWTWKSVGNGIYESVCGFDAANLIFNGAQMPMGRYPNAGYLSYEAHVGNTSITDNQLTASPNWAGAEAVIRKNRWTIDKSTITAHAGGTLTYAAGTKADPTNGYGYFIQNSPKTLDQLGEWYFDAARKTMMVYFGTQSPSSYVVRTSAVNMLVSIKGFNFITFENLGFVGAGVNAFNISNSKNISLKNCAIDYTGNEAVLASYSPNLTVENSTINHSLSGGINMDAGCMSGVILNNQIRNTAVFAGAGKSGSGTYEGITSFGDNTQIEKNTIDSTGYNGIYFIGNSSFAKNNVINYFCFVKDDGAGIYIGDWTKNLNKKVTGNIILNGIGASAGTNAVNSLQAEGIYVDDLSESVTISGNTISQCANNGIKIHNAKDINIFNNTVYNNGAQLRLEQDHYLATSTYIRNNAIRNNIFFSKTAVQPASKLSSHQDDIVLFGALDSNYYCRPVDELADITTSIVRNGSYLTPSYDLSAWKAAYGKDALSKQTPVAIPSYKISSLIGSNKFANGGFTSSIDGLYWYSIINDCLGTLSNGVLDGGALKLSFSALTGNHVTVNMKVGSIIANKKYVLRFSLLGTAAGKTMQTFLRKTGAPYTAISDQKNLNISTTRSENEVVFTATANDADASIIFDIDQPAGQVYFDNVQLYEADVTAANLNDYLLFEYNASSYAKTVALSRPYVDVQNRLYTNQVTISPYSSVILIAADQPFKASATTIMAAENNAVAPLSQPELKAYPNPFSNQLTLEFTLPSSGSGVLSLYDLQGKFITQVYSGTIKSGELQRFNLNASTLGLSEGIYIVRLVSGKKVLTQKVVKVSQLAGL